MPFNGRPSCPTASTPLDTSTAHGRTARTAAPTLPGWSPPESTIGRASRAHNCAESAPQANVRPVPPGMPSAGGASNSNPAASP